MLKLIILLVVLVSSQFSCQIKANEISLIEKGKNDIAANYIHMTSKKTLDNGNLSIIYNFGIKNKCRVEFNNKEDVLSSECDFDVNHTSAKLLEQQIQKIKEDMSISGYCSIKLKDLTESEEVKNNCKYSEYLLLSNCLDKKDCLDFEDWSLTNH